MLLKDCPMRLRSRFACFGMICAGWRLVGSGIAGVLEVGIENILEDIDIPSKSCELLRERNFQTTISKF